MNLTKPVSEKNRRKLLLRLPALLLFLLCALPTRAKIATDFDPNLDFAKFKTFAYIGGVESLARMQLNPDLWNNRIHRAVTRELTGKGLREVNPEENPDLVVRYWLNSQTDSSSTAHVNYGLYGPYYGYHWTFMYYGMSPNTTHQGELGIELIDAKSRDLAWRMFATVKVYNTNLNIDKIWKTADGDIQKAFKNYPPSPKAVEDKRKQWAKEDAAKQSSQP